MLLACLEKDLYKYHQETGLKSETEDGMDQEDWPPERKDWPPRIEEEVPGPPAEGKRNQTVCGLIYR